MKFATYEIEAGIEADHWWFCGCRKLLSIYIDALGLGLDAPILDVGTGTGTNLRLCQQLGYRNVTGLDNSRDAIDFCAAKGLGVVRYGDIGRMPFKKNMFKLLLVTDVLEHVDKDEKALQEIHRVLINDGTAIITVPTFECLWGLQDDVSFHKRRYNLYDLIEKIEAAGLYVYESFHFNYILFGPIWLARQIIRILKVPIKSENQVNTALLNSILRGVFTFDVLTARRLKPGFGVSGFIGVRKR